jgi:hypothetical protein
MKFDKSTQGILEMLAREAPKMELRKAYDFVQDYQAMRNDLRKYEFIIMMLLEAIGINDNGFLNNEENAERVKDLSENFWIALKEAIHVHAGFVCNPFTSSDWIENVKNDLNLKKDDSFKESQLLP